MAWDTAAAIGGDILTGGEVAGGAGVLSDIGGGGGLSAGDLAKSGFDLVGNDAGGGGLSLGDIAKYGSIFSGLGSGAGALASLIGSKQAAGAAQNAVNAQLGMFATQNAQQAPYRQAGQFGLSNLNYLAGASPGGETPASGEVAGNVPGLAQGGLLRPFTAADLKTNLAPNYQFMLGQGTGATTNLLNAQGGAISGNTLKGITDYAENYAGNAYQNAFSNYTANQTNIFNRLASIAGLGQTANAQSGTLAGALAPPIGQATSNVGAARAAGTVGAGANISSGIGNALGWYALPQMAQAFGNG